MNNTELLKSITFNLTSVAESTVGKEWNYKNVISSFSRLYLVTQGEASIYVGKEKVNLKKGCLYLIPSFTHCSYVCESELSHYYATFSIQLPNNLNIYQLFNFKYEVETTTEYLNFFKKLCELNPYKALPAKDPKVYQKINSKYWNLSIEDAQRSLMSSGLLYMFISKFIGTTKIDLYNVDSNEILATIKYIHSNLNEELTVGNLSDMTCLSSGHFSRKFKQLTELSPINYINKHRIEKAQLLLNSTSHSCVEIAEICGYKSNAYFCKTFKKYTSQTPGDYRNCL